MRIGFTGTREGMATDQWLRFQRKMTHFLDNGYNEFHDGDCIGADDQAFKSTQTLARNLDVEVQTHGHPCNLGEALRAYNEHDVTHPIYPPLVRNRHIVDSVRIMLAAPKEYEEVIRGSGTWATIRYALRKKRHLVILWPDGTFEEHNAGLPSI